MPHPRQVEYSRSDKKHSAHPLPTPGNGKHDKNEGSRNKMYGERKDGLPQAQAFVKNIQGKQAQEECKGDAQNPR